MPEFCIVLAFSKKWASFLQATKLVEDHLDLARPVQGFVWTPLFQSGIGPTTKMLVLESDPYSLCVAIPDSQW